MEKQAVTGIPVNQQYPPAEGNQAYPPPPQSNNQYGYQPGAQYPQQAPPYQPPGAPAQTGLWSTGLLDCFDDVPLCCLTCWCPCVTFGRIAEIVDKGSSTCGTTGALYSLILAFTGCQFIYSCSYRTRMRLEYGIPGDDVGDFCVHFWCETCALCQEYKELSIRGFEVPLGWHGNMARQNQGQVFQMAPVAQAGMTR